MYQYGAIDVETEAFGVEAKPNVQGVFGKPHRLCRLIDIVISLGVFLFTLPLLVFIATAIKLSDGGPILFGHARLGRGGRAFRCLKFRSMVVDAESRLAALLASDPLARAEWETSQKLRRDPRVTPLGDFLRRSSLDELPQVLNVLRGEMSVVGPRPIVRSEMCRYGRAYRYYCSVRPGITGLWQVSGRNDVSYRRRVALDRLYARSNSVSVDLAIIARTVPVVVMRSGSY